MSLDHQACLSQSVGLVGAWYALLEQTAILYPYAAHSNTPELKIKKQFSNPWHQPPYQPNITGSIMNRPHLVK